MDDLDESSHFYHLVSEKDLPRAFALESTSFPVDEGATLEKMQYRLENARELFLGLYEKEHERICTDNVCGIDLIETLIAYVNGTLSSTEKFTSETMSIHDPTGRTVCIHSVVVDHLFRGRGIGLELVKEYVRRLRKVNEAGEKKYTSVRLLAKQKLVKFYQSAGFALLGESEVVHGLDKWFELAIEL